ncbi:unnamed protein product [Urochloa decumbens]|uniref:Glycosyltransferase n=1 Tax=Urochloa decumbens TaxID=240449 RepID=A0ABC9G3N1_9POAL
MASSEPQPTPAKPHVLLIPYPAQGHVNPFLKLGKALHARGCHVTFVHTEYNHGRLLRARGPSAFDAGAEGFRFETIPDGLPPSDLDATQDIWALCEATRRTGPDAVRGLVERLNRAGGGVPPVSCVVADGAMGYVVHVAKEMGLPAYLFFTPSGCGYLVYLNFDQLVKRGYVPFKGALARHVRTQMGTRADRTLKRRWVAEKSEDAPTGVHTRTPYTYTHTLERHALDAIRARLPNTFTVGPLGPEVAPPSYLPSLTSSLWRGDDRCAAWLDGQAEGSVVYVNFGSITVVTCEQMDEFAWGLAAAGCPFLWVVRPDMVRDGGGWKLPEGWEEAVAGRGITVGWCDQEAVLEHPATGGFLSHCGWNSTLESLRAGVPLLCWPFFSEQVTNCRYACEEWGVGLEMPREAARGEVEAAVRELMGEEGRGAAARRKAAEWKEKARAAVAPGGSSQANFERFVQEITGATKC